ncbi:MAG: DNA polymerase III subunit epsilon [Pseudomonadota bacterium]
MREILLDTETTGLSPAQGHRIVEIGCIELMHKKPTGNTFHQYINPQRDVPAKSTEITGLTEAFLKPFPFFSQIVDKFLDFIGDDMLVIHNAPFDMSFLNAELEWAKKPILLKTRATDTLIMARKKFPGSPASLDALCKRFDIDLSKRDKHGALLDAELLYHVYIELLGGRQRTLAFELESIIETAHTHKSVIDFPKRSFSVSEEEEALHKDFIATLQNTSWNAK